MPDKTIHEGRNIKRIRELLDIKQETLAAELGDDWTQKKISLLEAKETIEPHLLEEVAKALKVSVETIKNFDEEKAIFSIQNMHDHAAIYQYNFNPVDKWIEALEENKKLYERLLKEKDAMIEELKKLLNKGN